MDTVGPILSEALQNLKPNSVADILVYIIFVGSFITLFLLPDGNDRAQYLMLGTLLFCIFDLLLMQQQLIVGGASAGALAAFGVHVGMFVFPAISVGSIRKGKRKPGPAIFMALITAVFGGLYGLITFAVLTQPNLISTFF